MVALAPGLASPATAQTAVSVPGESTNGACMDCMRTVYARAGFPEVEIRCRDQGGYDGAIAAPMLRHLQAEVKEHLGIDIGIRVTPLRDRSDAPFNQGNNLFLAPYDGAIITAAPA